MKAYDPILLKNTFLIAEAESLKSAGFINTKQLSFIEAALPSYQRSTGIVMRIGLFLLGMLLFSACCSAIGAFMAVGLTKSLWLPFLLFTIFGVIVMEVIIIRKQKYFANGIDDAFLFSTQMCFLLFVGLAMGDFDAIGTLFFICLLTGFFCCMRYVDSLSSFIACLGLTGLFTNFALQSGSTGRALLPFVLMFAAVLIMVFYILARRKLKSNIYYKSSLDVCFVFAAALFYLSSNYFVVREGGEKLINSYINEGSDIPLAWVFYFLTITIPLAYIVLGLRKRKRILLWLGILAASFSIYSIRYYYSLMPVEVALITGGIFIFAIAFFAMKKLKGKSEGLTFEPDKFVSDDSALNLEALVLIEHSSTRTKVPEQEIEFGGGEFGGAGSGDKY